MATHDPPDHRVVESTPAAGSGRRLVAVAAVALGLVAAVGAVHAYRRYVHPSGPLETNAQDPAPPLQVEPDPDRGEVRFADSGGIVGGGELIVEVVAPIGATEMQIGLDPTFTTTPWIPVAPTAVIPAEDTGYQMLFGRFRSGPGAPPSPVSVDGITIDPTYDAAISSLDGRHRPSWVRPLAATLLVVRVEAGRLQRGAQEAYDLDNPQPGDSVGGLFGPKTLERNGEPYGRQVGGRPTLIRTYDRLLGRPLDVAAVDNGRWVVSSATDPSYGSAVEAIDVRRVSRPAGTGRGPGDERIVPLVHDIILALPEALEPGGHYTIAGPPDHVEPIELELDPDRTISPAVHVNQSGYAPGDELKVAYLGGYPREVAPVAYAAGIGFRVIDAATEAVVVGGTTVARPGGDELGQGDLTGSDVFELDFSSLTAPGRYRVCVDGVGCSVDFVVDDGVWRDLTVAVARAMYHQRSGISLGPPYTSIGRPRPYHPDDGTIVRASELRMLDAFQLPLSELFGELVAGRGEEVVAGAWGGHFDAGDWDRRIHHLYYVRAVAELVERHPEVFASLSLGIPESGDGVPDLLDEGLWTLDLYGRLQRDDGAVPGGIEASEHPLPGTTSWTDGLAVSSFAPDPWSTYLYAGVAAEVSSVLVPYDRQRAGRYRTSALAAMAWAEAQPVEAEHRERVAAQRTVAAAALYEATGDQVWHRVFVETTSLGRGVDSALSCHEHSRCDAGWIYLRIDESMTEPELRATIEQSFVATAEEIVAALETTAYGWAVENRAVPLVWGLGPGGSPSAIGLLRAHAVTGDARFLAAAQRSAAVTLGANPTDTVFVTGVGHNPVRHPLIVDTLHGGLPVWAGTPVYGPHRIGLDRDDDWVDEHLLGPAGVAPLAGDAPYLWQWFDVNDVAMFNEFTVFQSHAEAIYAFGLLAAASS